MTRRLSLLLVALLASLAAACGGGDPDPDADVRPPDCTSRPELCR